MMGIALIFLLAGLTLLSIGLSKVYHHVPQRELKRRARAGDEFAELLYRVAAYGLGVDIILWLIIGLSSAGLFIVLARTLATWLALLIAALIIWVGFAWLPRGSRVTRFGTYLARLFAPSLAWLLSHLHPILSRISNGLHNLRPINVHTGLYQKDDLVDLIKRQQVQSDNRITEEELRIALHALNFGERSIGEVMTPRRMVKTVSSTEAVGPVLMDELHASGHSRFPVTGDKPSNIVGTLYLRNLLHKQKAGTVADVMDKKVYYVNEELSIEHALQAFLKTRHHLFMVVNRFEEIVGVLSIEDVLEQIIGKHIVDEFDQYDDLRAVAARAAQAERHNHVISPPKNISNTENDEKITAI